MTMVVGRSIVLLYIAEEGESGNEYVFEVVSFNSERHYFKYHMEWQKGSPYSCSDSQAFAFVIVIRCRV